MSVIQVPKTLAGKLLCAVAAVLLVTGTCAAAVFLDSSSSPRDCPHPRPGMAGIDPAHLEGRYQGPDGMTVDLTRDGAHTRVNAANWPFDLYDLDDGELGESDTGEVRKFSGSGSWEYGSTPEAKGKRTGSRYPYVSLDFTTGTPPEQVPPSPQYLMVGGTKQHPALFGQDDSSRCPDAVFRKQ